MRLKLTKESYMSRFRRSIEEVKKEDKDPNVRNFNQKARKRDNGGRNLTPRAIKS